MVGQARQQAQLARLAQAFGAERALGLELQAGVAGALRAARRATIQAQLAPQQAGLGALQVEAAVGEAELAPAAAEQRQRRAEAEIVAAPVHRALHLGLGQVGQRQAQAQLVIGIAAGAGRVQHMRGPAGQRRGADELQQFLNRPMGLAIDLHHGMGQIVDLGLGVTDLQAIAAFDSSAGVSHLEADAVYHQLAIELGQRRPVGLRRMGCAAFTRDEGVLAVLHGGADLELAQARIAKRHVPQIALDAEFDVVRLALLHGGLHVAAHLGRQQQRQVAVDALRGGTAEPALQIDHARKTRVAAAFGRIAAVPAELGLALGVGVGEAQAVGAHADALALQLPAQLGGQAGERHLGFLKDAGKAQAAVLQGQAGLAAVLVQREVQAGAADARAPRMWRLHAAVDRRWRRAGGPRRQLQGADAALEVVRAGAQRLAAPVPVQPLHQALRCE